MCDWKDVQRRGRLFCSRWLLQGGRAGQTGGRVAVECRRRISRRPSASAKVLNGFACSIPVGRRLDPDQTWAEAVDVSWSHGERRKPSRLVFGTGQVLARTSEGSMVIVPPNS